MAEGSDSLPDEAKPLPPGSLPRDEDFGSLLWKNLVRLAPALLVLMVLAT